MKLKKLLRTGGEYTAFVAPAIILVLTSSGIPFLMNTFYAFTKWNGIGKTVEFIGLQNFGEMFRERKFIQAMGFTFRYAVCFVVIVNILAIMFALILDSNIKVKNFLRTTLFMPYIISLVIVGFIWKMIFTKAFGTAFEMTGWGVFDLGWLSKPNMAFIGVLIVSLWQSVGFYMVIYTAGLQSISQEVLEAATVDGANAVVKLFKVKLPLMMQSITICIVLAITNALKIFDIIFTLTYGGPGDTTLSLAMNIYKEGFLNNRYGYATAKALIFFLTIMVFTLIQLRIMKRKEVEA